jgi:cytochrome c553
MTNAVHIAKYGRFLDVHRIVPGSKYAVDDCATLCRVCHGPQPKSRRGSRPIQSIRVSAEFYKRLKIAAIFRKMKPSEYVIKKLEHIVEEDVQALVAYFKAEYPAADDDASEDE